MHIVAALLIVALVVTGAVAYHRRGARRTNIPFA